MISSRYVMSLVYFYLCHIFLFVISIIKLMEDDGHACNYFILKLQLANA